MRLLAALVFFLAVTPLAEAQNSTKKIRPEPSALAARAGSAVRWRADLTTALAEAEESGKPVFWYLPTIDRSFMDRQPEVDRAMMAGPFSWPRLIDLLDERFVPLKLPADKALCERFGLRRVEFIEPGFLVLAPDGGELARHDRLSTLHPAWFDATLAPLVGLEPDLTNPLPWVGAAEEGSPEALFWRGALAWLSQREGDARAAWDELTTQFPDHPLAWKAAMELEGYGPLARGLESYAHVPAAALVPSGEGTQCAPGVYTEAELWRRGLEYLLAVQRSDGGYRDSIYDFGGTDGLPNVYVAVTAIAAIAMLEGAERLGAAPEDTALRARLEPALAAAMRYALDDGNLNPEDTDELVWGHLYRLRAATRYLALRGGRDQEDKGVAPPRIDLETLAEGLVNEQRSTGSWAHEYPNPFVTASALVALGEANALRPLKCASDAVAKGTQSLLSCRTDAGAYSYGAVRPGRPVRAQIEGSVGRSPLGELALEFWAPASSIGLEKAVALSFEHQHFLDPVRKYDDHTDRYAYGGFFYWYDVHARVEAIARLSEGARTAHAATQRAAIRAQPELDGAFIDSHEIGKAYGTAMALWCLAELD